MSEPKELDQYEVSFAIAVNGEVVGELRTKPGPLLSQIEDEVMGAVLESTFSSSDTLDSSEDPEITTDTELLEEYNPEVQVFFGETDEDEAEWTDSIPITDTGFM